MSAREMVTVVRSVPSIGKHMCSLVSRLRRMGLLL